MFRKILIANRGEIVLRIAAAAESLGIAVAGIYSENEKDSYWVRKLPEAYSLGDGIIADTYLDIEKIISVAERCKADAIHPGYGFLAENPSFARACFTHQIVFIGPSPEILELTGNKLAARNIAASLGIPVIKSFTGSGSELINQKESFTYPLIVKAVFGGGGKGMRLVYAPDEMEHAVHLASSEALLYFGDERIFVEQYMDKVRHIEIQLIADMQGHIIHLFDRECSLQRRHQKIIEEAPANVDIRIKEDLYHAAISFARNIGYTNAGTVEFLVDEAGNFHFLEMNPRIQVEHGITEMITGIDIVKEQIWIAEGNPLSILGQKISAKGHSIEARIYAEDPESDFIPAPGKIFAFVPPEMEGIRLDTAIESRSEISASYDPMIAKIMVHEQTREEAIKKIAWAIDHFAITGIRHNLSLLQQIFADNDFQHQKTSTQFLETKTTTYLENILTHRRKINSHHLLIAASLLVLGKNNDSESLWNHYWRNVYQIRFRFENRILEADFQKTGNGYHFYINEHVYNVSEIVIEWHAIHFNIDHETVKLYYLPEDDGLIELSDGHVHFYISRFFLPSQLSFPKADAETGSEHASLIVAPHPGTILDIKVAEGQIIKEGDHLMTIESMKLENTILALHSGMIKKINIKKGDKVKKNEPLVYLQ